MNCEHGRKPWKCNLCKREELKSVVVDCTTFDSPYKELRAVKPTDAYEQLRLILAKHDLVISIEQTRDLVARWCEFVHRVPAELTNAYECNPGHVKLRFSNRATTVKITQLTQFYMNLPQQAYNVYEEKTDPYTVFRAIMRRILGHTPSITLCRQVVQHFCDYGTLKKCKPHAGDPSLTQLEFYSKTHNVYHIKLITSDELSRKYRELDTYTTPFNKTVFGCDLAEAERRIAAALSRPLRVEHTDTARIKADTPNLLIDQPNTEVKVLCRATLIIGGVKYLIRFEGEKGHIIKC